MNLTLLLIQKMSPLGSILILLVIFIIILIPITVLVFYLLNLQNLLKTIKEENRDVEPANVWLMFIPLFNIVYAFILYPKISSSVKKEFESRGISNNDDGAKNLGLAFAITGAVAILPIPFLNIIIALGNLVLFIIWWVKTAGFKNKLS